MVKVEGNLIVVDLTTIIIATIVHFSSKIVVVTFDWITVISLETQSVNEINVVKYFVKGQVQVIKKVVLFVCDSKLLLFLDELRH